LTIGSSSFVGNSPSVNIIGNNSLAGDNTGGNVIVRGGFSNAPAQLGGAVYIEGGPASSSQSSPGDVHINSGLSGNTTSTASHVTIRGATAVNALDVKGNISCSVISASLLGTASWANISLAATSASYSSRSLFATSASFASASFTASYLTLGQYNVTGLTASVISSSVITASIAALTQINLATQSLAPAWGEGVIFYDTASHTLSHYNENSQMTVNLGQEQIIRVYNSSSNHIQNGSPCYISSSSPNGLPLAYLAIADGSGNKFDVAGVATTVISQSQYGYLTVSGKVNGLSINFPVGSPLWLSATSSGSYQVTQPTGSYERVFIGDLLASGSGTSTIGVDLHCHAYGAITASYAGSLVGSASITTLRISSSANVLGQSIGTNFIPVVDYTGSVRMASMISPSYYHFRDDFETGTLTDGFIGRGWRQVGAVGGTANTITSPSTTDYIHPGQITLTTATAAGTGSFLSMAPSAVGQFTPIDQTGWAYWCVFKLNQITGSRFFAGFSNATTVDESLRYCGLRYNTSASLADTKFLVACRDTGTTNSASLGVAADTSWHTFHMWSDVVGTIKATIDTGSIVTITNNSNNGGKFMVVGLVSDTTPAKSVVIDYIGAECQTPLRFG